MKAIMYGASPIVALVGGIILLFVAMNIVTHAFTDGLQWFEQPTIEQLFSGK